MIFLSQNARTTCRAAENYGLMCNPLVMTLLVLLPSVQCPLYLSPFEFPPNRLDLLLQTLSILSRDLCHAHTHAGIALLRGWSLIFAKTYVRGVFLTLPSFLPVVLRNGGAHLWRVARAFIPHDFVSVASRAIRYLIDFRSSGRCSELTVSDCLWNRISLLLCFVHG